MKKIVTSILAILILGSTFAQNKKNDMSIGMHLGTKMYNGDVTNEIFKLNDVSIAGGLSFHKYITKSWDFMGLVSLGQIANGSKERAFKTTLLDFNAMVKYKIANGVFLEEDAKIAPFLFGGIGDALAIGDHYSRGSIMDFNFPLGVGVDVNINDKFSINLISSFNQTLDDHYDNYYKGGNYDSFLFTALGLKMNLSSNKDSDGDGVADKEDNCPNSFGLLSMQGCPDTDGDGFADSDDQCPSESGTLNGCPDVDGDGVKDADDQCPNQSGSLNGCPDTDGDGIADKDDKCPKQKGIAELNGCPDSDGDGVADVDDKCPNDVGTLNGCPDKDGDMVADNDDKCPDTAGIVANKGCPEISEEEKEVMNHAIEGLFFKSGSSVIKNESFKVLDEVAGVLKKHPEYNLHISGHTDSSGDADKNMKLSVDRANAAKQYLEGKGISGSRIIADGFGITKPVASNDTAEGRAKNRRVEFKIEF